MYFSLRAPSNLSLRLGCVVSCRWLTLASRRGNLRFTRKLISDISETPSHHHHQLACAVNSKQLHQKTQKIALRLSEKDLHTAKISLETSALLKHQTEHGHADKVRTDDKAIAEQEEVVDCQLQKSLVWVVAIIFGLLRSVWGWTWGESFYDFIILFKFKFFML